MKALSILVFVPVIAMASTPMPDHSPNSGAMQIYSIANMQDPQGEVDPVTLGCPKRKSVIMPGSPVSVSSAPTTTCDDGAACGYTRTYNPPVTQCESTTLKVCCVEQMQRAYTQAFSCQADGEYPDPESTTCVGGAKSPFGSTHVVFVTVRCHDETGECGEPGDY